MDRIAGKQDVGEKSQSRWILILASIAIALSSIWLLFYPIKHTSAAQVGAGLKKLPAHSREKSDRQAISEAQLAAQDLTITKTLSGDFVIGSSGVYTISVTNVGTSTLTGPITMTDYLPDNLSLMVVSGEGWNPCGSLAAHTISCIYSNSLGLAAGVALQPIRLIVSVSETTDKVITNTAVVTNTNDTVLDNNVVQVPTILGGVDLATAKTVTPTLPVETGAITYTVIITNNGPGNASGVILTDTLPVSITYRGAQASQGTYTASTGQWTVGSINSDDVATLDLYATLNTGTRGKVITNTIDGLTADQDDYNPDNNLASASFFVSTAQLAGQVTDAATEDPIKDVLLKLTDSANQIFTSTSVASGWYTFTSTITNPIEGGSASLQASKTGYITKTLNVTLNPGVLNRVDIALDTVDLLVEKTDNQSTVIPGETVTYTINVSNIGSIAATNVIITDVLPSQLTYITDTLDITHSIPVAHTYVWKLPDDLDPEEEISFELVAEIANALPSPNTALTNSAYVNTDSVEANTANNVAQDTNTSTGTASLSITLSVSPSQVRTNQDATYTIRVENNGTAPATNVVVSDSFSTYLDLRSARTTKGTATSNSSTRRVTVTINVLEPDEEVTITVVTRVNTTARSNVTVSNSASMTYVFGGSTFSRSSNVASFQIIATSTLPGTGGMELMNQESQIYVPAMLSAILLAVIGLLILGYAVWVWKERLIWEGWYLKMGGLMVSAAIVFAIVAIRLHQYEQAKSISAIELSRAPNVALLRADPTIAQTSGYYQVIYPPTEEPETLPDFPIPTPNIESIPEDPDKSTDISAVNRIVIPSLGLDTVVKYVPFDGLTWLIAGLKQEVAWMGDTSWPGLGGNTGLAGHVTLRNGGEGPFRYLSELQAGDRVYIYTEENIYTYTVRENETVEETDMSVLGQARNNQITLITCTEWDTFTGFYKKRLVVFAEQVDVEPVQVMAIRD